MYSKADLHVHTRCSYDSIAPIKSIINRALEKDFKIIAITDHDTIRGALKVKKYVEKNGIPLQVIVGEEISTLNGHVIGLFLKEHIPPMMTMEETIDRIKSQGGLVIIPHPVFSKKRPRPHIFRIRVHYLDLIENPHILEKVDAIEAANFTMFDIGFGKKVHKYSDQFNKALVGSSDAHIPRDIGTMYTSFPGSTIEDLKQAISNRTTKEVISRVWTPTDVILHYTCAFKMPFTYASYTIKNLIQKFFRDILSSSGKNATDRASGLKPQPSLQPEPTDQ